MTVSQKACESQYLADNYPGIDNWTDSPLQKGNIIYVWEADNQTEHPGGGVYATTPKTALQCDGDPNILQDALQTNLDSSYDSHRGIVRAYEINDNVDAAFAHCEANICHGKGGGDQYFIPDFDEKLQDGMISRRADLDLHFGSDKLHINEDTIKQNTIDTLNQINTSPKQISQESGQPLPSVNTTPTLDGAYNGKTENLADDIKPQVDYFNQNNYEYNYGIGM